MPRVYIGVGSNIDPEENISRALRMLAEAVQIVGISTFYRTPPVGSPDSPDFYDGMVAVDTDVAPRVLKFEALRKIEAALGRVRSADRNAARTIDLDIALYGDMIIDEPDLVIPDPELTERAFLVVPLLELDPGLVLPGSNMRLADADASPDCKFMIALDEFTNKLKREHL